jgi:hypothetical protein
MTQSQQRSSTWQPPDTAPKRENILVRGPFGIAVAQLDEGQFWAMAGKLEAYGIGKQCRQRELEREAMHGVEP